jgi:hypothetical protein
MQNPRILDFVYCSAFLQTFIMVTFGTKEAMLFLFPWVSLLWLIVA